MGTKHEEGGKAYSPEPGLGMAAMLVGSHTSPLNLSSESLSLSLFSSGKKQQECMLAEPLPRSKCFRCTPHPQLFSRGMNLYLVPGPGAHGQALSGLRPGSFRAQTVGAYLYTNPYRPVLIWRS